MARKEPQNRPTQAQIKRSQKRLVGFIARYDKPLDVAAQKLRVSQKQLKNFLFQPVKKTRSAFTRTDAYKRLYEQAGKAGPIAGIKRIPKIRVQREYGRDESGVITGEIIETVRIGGSFSYTHYADRGQILSKRQYHAPKNISYESRRRASVITHAVLLEHETPEASMTIAWQIYTSERNMPTSINAIKQMYQDGEISRSMARTALSHWHAIYSDMDDDYYDDMVDDFGFDDYD